MSISGIQGHLLEVTVVGCLKLKDTEWISRQDPYVCLEYANTKFRTRTCTDGGKNPVFQEKFVFTLIEGLREINVVVWNSNTLSFDDFIGSGKVQLQDVLCRGYDDRPWPIQTKTGRYAGEVKLIMHYAHASKQDHTSYASAPPYPTHQPQTPMYSSAAYPSAPSAYLNPQTCHHPPPPSSYPATCTSPYSYPPDPTPPYSSPYPYPPPNNNPSAYPPGAYPPPPSTYPPSPYPPPYPPPTVYPPPTYGSAYPPPGGHYNGQYPPPPY